MKQTVIYLQYPRQLLTRHFWSYQQRQQYFAEGYEERRLYSSRLISSLHMKSIIDAIVYKDISLDELRSDDIRSLAGANAICSTQLLVRYVLPHVKYVIMSSFRCGYD
jgi:hypothetical protein